MKAESEKAVTAAKAEWAKTQTTAWRDTITDPTLKEAASRFPSVGDILKSNNELRADNTKRVRVPDDKASPEDKTKFRLAIGVPEKVEFDKENSVWKGYEYKLPKFTEDGAPQKMQVAGKDIEVTPDDVALVNAVTPLMHAAGVPKGAYTDAINAALNLNAQVRQAHVEALNTYREQQETALRREWPGKDYDTNMTVAKRVILQLGGDELLQTLNATPLGKGTMGDHPVIVKAFAKMGRMNAEGGLELMGSAESRNNAITELRDIQAKVPVGSAEYLTEAHQKKLGDAYKAVYGDQAIVGQGGRSA